MATDSFYYAHHSYVPTSIWRWPNFTPQEIASNGNGSVLINPNAMDKLQYARELAKKPFFINSAYRDEQYNAMVGGVPRSYHLEGRAFDISLRNFSKSELIAILTEAGFTGLGVRYHSFVHADNGRKRQW